MRGMWVVVWCGADGAKLGGSSGIEVGSGVAICRWRSPWAANWLKIAFAFPIAVPIVATKALALCPTIVFRIL